MHLCWRSVAILWTEYPHDFKWSLKRVILICLKMFFPRLNWTIFTGYLDTCFEAHRQPRRSCKCQTQVIKPHIRFTVQETQHFMFEEAWGKMTAMSQEGRNDKDKYYRKKKTCNAAFCSYSNLNEKSFDSFGFFSRENLTFCVHSTREWGVVISWWITNVLFWLRFSFTGWIWHCYPK